MFHKMMLLLSPSNRDNVCRFLFIVQNAQLDHLNSIIVGVTETSGVGQNCQRCKHFPSTVRSGEMAGGFRGGCQADCGVEGNGFSKG